MIWIFAGLLWAGILSMRVESRWALTLFQTALFTLAAIAIVRQRFAIRFHPIGVLLACVVLWGLMQVWAGITVDAQRTLASSLDWAANCVAFCLALRLTSDRAVRQRFLTAQLIFSLAVAIGAVIWLFTLGSLGPFVYRNQFAAFLEPALGLAIAAAIGDRKRPMLWVFIAAALFGDLPGVVDRAAGVRVSTGRDFGAGAGEGDRTGSGLGLRAGGGGGMADDLGEVAGAESLFSAGGFESVIAGDGEGAAVDGVRAGDLVVGVSQICTLR
jgi:hypothetical protein